MMSLNILVLFSSSHEKWALRKIKKLFLGVVVASLGRRLGTLQAAVCRCGRNLESASPFFFFFFSSLSLPFCGSYIITMRTVSCTKNEKLFHKFIIRLHDKCVDVILQNNNYTCIFTRLPQTYPSIGDGAFSRS